MKWQLSLDTIAQERACGLPNRVVVADAGYGDTTRRAGRSPTLLCRRYFLNDESVEQTTTNTSSTLPETGRSGTRYAFGEQRPTCAQDVERIPQECWVASRDAFSSTLARFQFIQLRHSENVACENFLLSIIR